MTGIAEVYFLVRTGVWGEQELKDYVRSETSDAFEAGMNSHGIRYTAEQLREAEVRGYNAGYLQCEQRQRLYNDDNE